MALHIDDINTSVLLKVADHERWFADRIARLRAEGNPKMVPKLVRDLEAYCKERVEHEWTVYATVQVIRHSRGFSLVYCGQDGSTGPFATREKAEQWFLNGGR